MAYSKIEKDNFFKAVDSLKKYRRAELYDENGNQLIDELYTDLLPNKHIMNICLSNNTTFLVGRKGTGKSTIFLKLQHEIRKNNTAISAYIDVKTVYENSQTEYVNSEYLLEVINEDMLKKYLLQRTFIQNILKEISCEIDKKVESIFDKLKKVFGKDKKPHVKHAIEELFHKIEDNELLREIEVPILRQVGSKFKQEQVGKSTRGNKAEIEGSAGLKEQQLKLKISADEGQEKTEQSSAEYDFSGVFLQVFQIKDIIEQIKYILEQLNIRQLVVLLDDFSEIDDEAIKLFMDVILAPLNNWSNEFIKFKVAAYPNRIPYGKLQLDKIDVIKLDFYNLYSEYARDKMEERAVEFTHRLLEKRLKHFTKKDMSYFFDINSENDLKDYLELIFQVSMNVPRIIGYVLFYCHNSNILYDKPITKNAIEMAAQKYYSDIIRSFFDATTYSIMAIDEKISILQMNKLLNRIVDAQKQIKSKVLTGELTGEAYNKTFPHTSHFFILPQYEQFLKTLELNFFITKYNELSSRDKEKVAVYALNYGLCKKNNLRWGKPGDKRKYFIERPFNFTALVDDFLKNTKRIVCKNSECGNEYGMDKIEFLQFTNMKCPDCHTDVKVVSMLDSIREDIEKIDDTKLLPPIEYSILYELYKNEKPLKAKMIAEELDCSYQLIGQKAKILDEDRGLIERSKGENGGRIYALKEVAKATYFANKE